MDQLAAHEILGISRFASADQVREAHRIKLKKLGSSLAGTHCGAGKEMQSINVARDEMLKRSLPVTRSIDFTEIFLPIVQANFKIAQTASNFFFSAFGGWQRPTPKTDNPATSARFH